ncbi:hypothetical protein [Streptomyces griseoviridis]|uniref:Secreted protein n=1 Tax=Streptomyces griseoviridis TaxID=45398 RepID=A0ABT9LDM1_STRGD|nr:hypothetical protein [Streptomyces griseoviridis]MDP9681826.1 hypothetical protein [Streptomyces griseoviridis]GGS71812.1 hypothetical protein GCM10010240_00630 [Streptomyces griseoviridis]
MPASDVSAEAIAARLSAAGLTTHVEEHVRHTTVKAEIPESLSAESWREVLVAAAEADRFGLHVTSLNGRTLWAVVRKAVPATGDVGGPGHQR